MGLSLGTQCVRCHRCMQTSEIDVSEYINKNPQLLTEGFNCPTCAGQNTVGLSYYSENNLDRVTRTIRSHCAIDGGIKCVSNNGTVIMM